MLLIFLSLILLIVFDKWKYSLPLRWFSLLFSIPCLTMPARTFSDSVEAILLTIWSKMLNCSDKMMKTRAAKEKYATTLLNKKVEEQGNDRKYTVPEVHDKIDSLKKKVRDAYKACRLPTATGTPLDEGQYDLSVAAAPWPNFELYHSLFFQHPQYGPGECVESLTVADNDVPRQSSETSPSPGLALTTPSSRSASLG